MDTRRTDALGRRMRAAAAIATVALGLLSLGAGSASAGVATTTLSWAGAVDTTDPGLGFTYDQLIYDNNGPTSCGSDIQIQAQDVSDSIRYDAYAFRNVSGSSDCVVVQGTTPTSCGEPIFDFSLTFAQTTFAGSDDFNTLDCGTNAHSYDLAAGDDGIAFVVSDPVDNGGPVPYGLQVSGSDVVPAQVVDVLGDGMSDNNTLTVHTSSLADGTGVDGSVTVSDDAGRKFSGPVQCLRVSGHNATLVMTYDPGQTTGQPAKYRGHVFWLHQAADADGDGERNASLTQYQLNHRYASCPDPDKPLGGAFAPLASGSVLVASDPPQTTGT